LPSTQQLRTSCRAPGHSEHFEGLIHVYVADCRDVESDDLDNSVNDCLQGFHQTATAIDLSDQVVHPAQSREVNGMLDWAANPGR
jgi:hypothetical protein